MLVTLDTSHASRGWLNTSAWKSICSMLVTFPMDQEPLRARPGKPRVSLQEAWRWLRAGGRRRSSERRVAHAEGEEEGVHRVQELRVAHIGWLKDLQL